MKNAATALLTGVSVLCFLAGCASNPVSVSPVGPEPPHAVHQTLPRGYLIVYSETDTHEIGKNTFYYTHTPYSVYDLSGLRVKWVPNHLGDMDEDPTLVDLPVGRYHVLAQSSSYGRVTIPIIIGEAKTTVLHLNRDWHPAPGASSNAIVRLPDGEPIGWSVAATR